MNPESAFYPDAVLVQDFYDSGEYRETGFLIKQGNFSIMYQNSELWVTIRVKKNMIVLSKKINNQQEKEKSRKKEIILSIPYFSVDLPESLVKSGFPKQFKMEPNPGNVSRQIINYNVDETLIDPVFNFNSSFNFGLLDSNFKLLFSEKIGFRNLTKTQIHKSETKITTPDSYVYCYLDNTYTFKKKSEISKNKAKYRFGDYWAFSSNKILFVTKKPYLVLNPVTKKAEYQGIKLPISWKLGMPIPVNIL